VPSTSIDPKPPLVLRDTRATSARDFRTCRERTIDAGSTRLRPGPEVGAGSHCFRVGTANPVVPPVVGPLSICKPARRPPGRVRVHRPPRPTGPTARAKLRPYQWSGRSCPYGHRPEGNPRTPVLPADHRTITGSNARPSVSSPLPLEAGVVYSALSTRLSSPGPAPMSGRKPRCRVFPAEISPGHHATPGVPRCYLRSLIGGEPAQVLPAFLGAYNRGGRCTRTSWPTATPSAKVSISPSSRWPRALGTPGGKAELPSSSARAGIKRG